MLRFHQLTGSEGAGIRAYAGNGGETPPRALDWARVETIDRLKRGVRARDAMVKIVSFSVKKDDESKTQQRSTKRRATRPTTREMDEEGVSPPNSLTDGRLDERRKNKSYSGVRSTKYLKSEKR